MIDDPYDLDRFIKAQARCFDQALAELTAGTKRTHWMWFIFPQLKGLGHSEMAQFYGISSLDEARAYLAHPLLGARLGECTEAMLGHGDRTAAVILGPVDAVKFRSSMTLFEAAGGGDRFGRALETFCRGVRDPATLTLLG